MQICVLGSSSAGNCTVIWDEDHAILVDCGFGPQFIEKGLHALALKISALDGVLITHVHGDHVNPFALDHLLGHKVPVAVPRKVGRVLERRYLFFKDARERNLIRDPEGSGIELGKFDVRSFPVPHDAPGGCNGYKVAAGSGRGRRRVTVATDLGYPQEGLEESFIDSDLLVIESNHDVDMLESSRRPEWLKRRIREIGHLSNEQCAEFVTSVLERSRQVPHTIVLAHISQECNTNDRAVKCIQQRLYDKGFSHVKVVPTFEYKATAVTKI